MAQPNPDIVIVGAGIIGIAIAAYLSETERSVTIIDRTGICEETSAGNAAGFAFSELLPLAHRGMWRQVPRWLADPLGPLSIAPSYLPKLAPWLLRFLRAGSPKGFERAVAAQAALMTLSRAEWAALMDRSGTRPMLREDGCLELYDSEASFKRARAGYDLRERYGIAFAHLRRHELQDYQPGLSSHFAAGTFVPEWQTVSDPQALAKAVWAYAEARGARFVQGTVISVRESDAGAEAKLEDGRTLSAKALIVAAGAWSHRLAAKLGDTIPLETERGYNTTLPADAFDLKRQLSFADHGFVVTPLDGRIRVGGAVEFAGLERPPNFARAKAMLQKAKRFLPGLKSGDGHEWMGYRPSLPDSAPVIGRASGARNVFYAFGHGHLGLTQAAATGRLICDLVCGEDASIDLAPFSPERF